jgi:hypothetical protein
MIYKKLHQISKEIMGKDLRQENNEDFDGDSISESVFFTKDFLKSLSLLTQKMQLSKENFNRN